MYSIKSTVALLILLCFVSAISLKDHDASAAEFCWKESYGRGVGTIPSVCPAEKDKIGLLCYSKCPSGFSRFGFDCHQNCLSGWRDDGLFCRSAEYGRGAGYPWRFGDPLNDSKMYRRCEGDNGAGNCEKWGAVVYPKCKQGYYTVGCCICRPSTPNCNALGYNGGLDLSCAKKVIIGDPKSMDCPSGQIYDAGLCYQGCGTGYTGVGPVCWGGPPNGWVNCGMGAAKTDKICGMIIFDQVTSVGNMALSIATLGAGKTATIASDAVKLADLKKQFSNMKKLVDTTSKVQDLIAKDQSKFPTPQGKKNTVETLKANVESLSPEDIVRISAQIASLVDPSGVSGVISTFTYPKCSAVKV